jgi:FKBP-type peptidyl-prolyl cis-trans isomerase
MNTFQKLILAAVMICSFDAAAQTKKPTANTGNRKPASKEDSLQYSLGVYLGQWIRDNGFTTFDAAQFMSGLEDVYKKQPTRFPDSVVTRLLNEHRQTFQLAMNRQLETKLFASMADTPGIKSLSGGMKYLVRRQGTGVRPSASDSVLISFKGVLANGAVFEDTYEKKQAVYTTPATLFEGFKNALLEMPAGSLWQLYIPAAMAYGNTGNGTSIPPGNALIILVNLIQVKKN